MSDIECKPKTAADIFCGRPFGGPIKNINDNTYLVGDGAPVEFTPNYKTNPFTKYGATNFNTDKMAIKDDGTVIAKPKRRNKSKQAYGILKDLDYEYDLVKQRWFKKQYVD